METMHEVTIYFKTLDGLEMSERVIMTDSLKRNPPRYLFRHKKTEGVRQYYSVDGITFHEQEETLSKQKD